jgi:hypothetical protein
MTLNETYCEHIKSICDKLAQEIAPKVTANLGFKESSEVVSLFEYVSNQFAESLKKKMLEDIRKYGWQV